MLIKQIKLPILQIESLTVNQDNSDKRQTHNY